MDILFYFALFWLFIVWTFGFYFCLCSRFVFVHVLLACVFLLFVQFVGLVCLLETGFLSVSPAVLELAMQTKWL